MKNLFDKMTSEWLKAAAIRAVRTMAQVALSMFTLGAATNEINWLNMLSVAFVAGVYSILTSISTTLPEVGTDGTLQIDTTGETDIYRLNLNNDVSTLATKAHVVLVVDPKAILSQK